MNDSRRTSRQPEPTRRPPRPTARRDATLRASARIDEIREQGRAASDTPAAPTRRPRASEQIRRNRQARSFVRPDRPSARPAAKAAESRVASRHPAKQEGEAASAPVRARHAKPTRRSSAAKARKSMAVPASIGDGTLAQGLWTPTPAAKHGRPRAGGGKAVPPARPPRESKRRRLPAPVLCALALVVVLVVAFCADGIATGGKIHDGVSIGDVDVSGKTHDEAVALVSEEYAPRVAANVAVFYATDDDKANPKIADTDETIEEQISYEESLKNRTQWTVPATDVDAVFDVDNLVDQAMSVGRDNGGVVARLEAAFGGWDVQPVCSLNDSVLDDLTSQMTAAVGTERVNYDVAMNDDATAETTEGHDGDEVTEQWLTDHLNEAFLGTSEKSEYVLETTYEPLQVTQDDAQKVADSINASIAQGAVFTFEDQSWTATREDLAGWISTSLVQDGDNAQLKPVFDETKAKSALFSALHSNIEGGSLAVSFAKANDGTISVSTNSTGTVPLVVEAIKSFDDTFFVTDERTEAPQVTVESTQLPQSCSLDDARNFGIVTQVSTYTTQFSSGAEARVHNIHTAADYLNDSIATANGGTWSFNDIAGEATVDRGYQDAGAIVAGEYSDAIGGGICQVATTVFNAVYEAGYPVTERHNHSLRISSYPEGRDAAIAFPHLNLAWQNDTSSDVLLVMSYTDSSLTATLWGVDPGYQVSTKYGDWKKGEPYSVTYKSDNTVKSGTQYVSTTGVNGSSITIVRTVKDASGAILHEDTFDSDYAPKNEVIVKGTA